MQGDVHFVEAGSGSEVAIWTFAGLAAGTYRVSATWSEHPNRATNAPFTVLDGTTALASVLGNQELVPDVAAPAVRALPGTDLASAERWGAVAASAG